MRDSLGAELKRLRELAAVEEGLSCVVSDALGRGMGMSPRVSAMWPGAQLVGRAVTAYSPAGDLGPVLDAVDVAQPGDVIVVQGAGAAGAALWGENMTLSALNQGVAGAVLDAPCRDRTAHGRLAFPVFAVGSTPRGGLVRNLGRSQCPVHVAGVRVTPGDVVIADENGAVVIPVARLAALVAALPRLLDKERRVQQRLQQGGTLGMIMRGAAEGG